MHTATHNELQSPSYHLAQTKLATSRDCSYRNQAIGTSQAIMLSVNRDSSALARSNWRVIVADMQKRFGDESDLDNVASGWHIERFGHWACGWIDYLLIDVYSTSVPEPGLSDPQTTEPFDVMVDWLVALDDYPIANEDDYSQLESEELYDYLSSEIGFMRRRDQLTARAPKSNDLIIHRLQQTSAFNCIGGIEDISGDPITEGLQALGYAYKHNR